MTRESNSARCAIALAQLGGSASSADVAARVNLRPHQVAHHFRVLVARAPTILFRETVKQQRRVWVLSSALGALDTLLAAT